MKGYLGLESRGILSPFFFGIFQIKLGSETAENGDVGNIFANMSIPLAQPYSRNNARNPPKK